MAAARHPLATLPAAFLALGLLAGLLAPGAVAQTVDARIDALARVLDYRQPGTAFSDEASHFGLNFSEHAGIAGLRAAWNRLPVDASLRFARVRLLDATTGNALLENATLTRSLPHMAVQSARSRVLNATLNTFFVSTNACYTRIRIENPTDRARGVLLAIDGYLPADETSGGRRELYLSQSLALLLSAQYTAPHKSDLSTVNLWAKIVPNFNLNRCDVSFGQQNTVLDDRNRVFQAKGAVYYRMVSAPLTIPAGGTVETGFGSLFAVRDAAFCVNNEGLLLNAFQFPDQAQAVALSRWRTFYSRLPRPALDDADLQLAYDHAWQVLRSNLLSGSPAFSTIRAGRVPLCSKFERSELTPLQAPAIAVAWAEGQVEIAKGAVLQLMDNLGPNGELRTQSPSRNEWLQREPYAGSDLPLIGWAAWEVYQRDRDRQFLRNLFPDLLKNVGWWYETHFRPGLQIFAYAAAGEMGETPAGRSDLADPVTSRGLFGADLNAAILSEVRALARVCDELDQPYEGVRWTYRADALAGAIAEHLFSNDLEMPTDLWADQRAHSETPWLRSFYGVWAGVPLADDGALRALENVLLSPRMFGLDPPLPTVGRRSATYKPDQVDAGAIVPVDHLFYASALHKHGLDEDADALADAVLRMVARSRVFGYAYHAETGECLRTEGVNASSTAANYILLALRRYRLDTPGAVLPAR